MIKICNVTRAVGLVTYCN